jgi:hypothetical protein
MTAAFGVCRGSRRIGTRNGRGGWGDTVEGAYLLCRWLDRACSRRVSGQKDSSIMAAGRSWSLRAHALSLRLLLCRPPWLAGFSVVVAGGGLITSHHRRARRQSSPLPLWSPPRCLYPSSQWLCLPPWPWLVADGGGKIMPRQVLSPVARLTAVTRGGPWAVVTWFDILSSGSWAHEACDCPVPPWRS